MNYISAQLKGVAPLTAHSDGVSDEAHTFFNKVNDEVVSNGHEFLSTHSIDGGRVTYYDYKSGRFIYFKHQHSNHLVMGVYKDIGDSSLYDCPIPFDVYDHTPIKEVVSNILRIFDGQ
jgi:hypothetical protein